MGDINEALAQIRALQQYPLPDDQPQIEAPAFHVTVADPWTNVNFDNELRPFGNERFQFYILETQAIGKLEENLREGQIFLSQLYAYRSVSRAIPQPQQDQKDKVEINEKTYEVLKPEIAKAKKLMTFCEKAVQTIVQIIGSMNEERKKEKAFLSDQLLLSLAKNFNMFVVLDGLKNMKTSLSNDCAIYKRAITNMKLANTANDNETKENEMLRMFLANVDSFKSNLKTQLQSLQVEDILVDLINTCADFFEEKKYLLPETKHLLLKALALGLYLLDDDVRNMEKVKGLKMDKYAKLFKVNPVVPFTGDMASTLSNIYSKAKYVNEYMSKFVSSDEENGLRYNLIHSLDEATRNYNAFVNNFGIILNETRALSVNGDFPDSHAKSIYDLVFQGFQLLGRWTCAVSEQTAWKFSNPTDHIRNRFCPEDASDYEKTVRYNYDSSEKFAFIEYISMIKSMENMLSSHATLFENAIRKHIFTQLQYFLLVTLAEITAHATKKKKAIVNTLLFIRNIAADTSQGISNMATGTMKGKKKGIPDDSATQLTINQRSTGIYGAQLCLVRALLDSCFNERAAGMKGGFMKDKDFSSQQVEEMSKFYEESYYYPAMLNFIETLDECCDLSELWYKEFFLELSKEIQFPIEMSLPWILTDHILETDAADMMEYLLYPLDLYNDAAHRALHKLQRQFLFDEIEAELNLAFDQFIFKLSHKVFIHYKTLASSHLINKQYKTELHNYLDVNDANAYEPPINRYQSILSQRHVQMLGRSIDINKLVSQRFLQNLRKSVEVAVQRFEASDLTNISELYLLLEHNRVTHALANEILNLGSFDSILTEIDESVSLQTFTGRMITHAMSEIVNDFLPNYCYNTVTERFVRTPFSLVPAIQRGHMPKPQPYFLFGTRKFNDAFLQMLEVNRNFIGEPHIFAIVRLFGRKHLPVILGELINNCELIFATVAQYMETISRGFPQSSKLPPIVFGMKGAYDYFASILAPVLKYRDLKTEVFQSFREVGNSFAFAHLIDKIAQHEEMFNIIYSNPFLGILSSTSEGQVDPKMILKEVLSANGNVFAQSIVSYGQLAEKVDSLTRPNAKLPSFFEAFVRAFDSRVLSPVKGTWRGSEPTNDVIEIDYCLEFYRLWSAVQFAVCTPSLNANEFTSRELFGEGLQWAGIGIIFLLGQMNRFNAFDFSYHLLSLSHLDKKGLETINTPGLDLPKFLENTTFYKAINDEFFQYLATKLGKPESKSGEFLPPTIGVDDGKYVSYPGEHGTAPRVVSEKKIITQA